MTFRKQMLQQLLLEEILNFCLQMFSTSRIILFIKSFKLKYENNTSRKNEEGYPVYFRSILNSSGIMHSNIK